MGFEDWYRSNYRSVLSTLVAMAGDVNVGRELTDEAFARAFERWAKVQEMESPTGWTYTVATNLYRRRLRRARLERRALARLRPTDEKYAPASLPVELVDAIGELPLRHRQVVSLRYVADLTESEVARVLRLSPGNVARLLHEARRSLAMSLAAPPQDLVHGGYGNARPV